MGQKLFIEVGTEVQLTRLSVREARVPLACLRRPAAMASIQSGSEARKFG